MSPLTSFTRISQTALIYRLADKYKFMSIISTNIAAQIIEGVIAEAQAKVQLNHFIDKNMVPFTLVKQNQSLQETIDQVTFAPNNINIIEDQQPTLPKEDSLMTSFINQTKFPDRSRVTDSAKNQAVSIKRVSQSIASVRTKKSQTPHQLQQHKSLIPSKQKAVIEIDHVIDKMRDRIQRERSIKVHIPERQSLNKGFKNQKNQVLVYGYDGKIDKTKQIAKQDFAGGVLTGKIDQQKSLPMTNKIIASSHAKQSKKSRADMLQHLDQKTKQLKSQANREDMIKSVLIQHPGVQMTFDGKRIQQNVSSQLKDKHIKRQDFKQDFSALKRKTQSTKNRKIITQVLEVQIQLPKSTSVVVKKKIRTQGPQLKPTTQRIRVQSQLLKQTLLDPFDIQDNYAYLPKQTFAKKRVVSQNDRNSNASQYKIQRILSQRRQQKLPKLINNSRRIQSSIQRQLRKKTII